MKNKGFSPSVGAPSILMIFVVLCLTAFGVLSFATAGSYRKLAEKHAESLRAYYAADAKAQEMLGRIDAKLYEARPALPDDPEQAAAELSALLGRDLPAQTEIVGTGGGEDTPQIRFQIPVNGFQQLEVAMEPQRDGKRYRILRYRLAAVTQWQGGDQRLDVWQGPNSQESKGKKDDN